MWVANDVLLSWLRGRRVNDSKKVARVQCMEVKASSDGGEKVSVRLCVVVHFPLNVL